MRVKKPEIPKRLAARIRAAQAKLREAISFYVHDESDILAIQDELRRFDENPKLRADIRYPRQDVESYPVQTRIHRERERLERKLVGRPRRLKDPMRCPELFCTLMISSKPLAIMSMDASHSPHFPFSLLLLRLALKPSPPLGVSEHPWLLMELRRRVPTPIDDAQAA